MICVLFLLVKILWELCEFHNSFMQKFLMLQFSKLAKSMVLLIQLCKNYPFKKKTQERKVVLPPIKLKQGTFSFASCDWLYFVFLPIMAHAIY